MKVSDSNEVENNPQEAQINCQKSINQMLYIPLQLFLQEILYLLQENSNIYADILVNR